MNPEIPTKEGFVPFRGYKTWYRIVGDHEEPGEFPLLCLHGGPGFPHDYLELLEAMAKTGRRVIFYDQLGCGNSNVPPDQSIYTMALYLEEVEVIRQALGLERVHIFGHSWGGMLAMEYALTQPAGLSSLILADTAASSPQWVAEMRRMVDGLPPDLRQTILKHESASTTDSKEYQDAVNAFFRLYSGIRLDPRPEYLKRMVDKPGDDVYRVMWGPSEFFMTGTLKDWDVTERLGEILTPTLVIGGRYDHATPLLTEALHRGLNNSEWVIFEKSGHFPHIDETERFLQVLDQFLCRIEANISGVVMKGAKP
jgi:proline-specific peptidase